jgi:transposase InsO family protein
MTDRNSKIDIVLSIGNYTTWAAKMYSLLVLKDYEDVLTTPLLDNPLDSDDDSDAEEGHQRSLILKYREWKKKSAKVHALIVLNIDEHNMHRIAGTKEGKEAWEVLKIYHQKNTVGNKQRLQEKISSLRKKNTTSMHVHLDKLFSLVARYREAGADFNDEEFVRQILNSIRQSHRNLYDSITIQSQFDKDPWGLRLWLMDYEEDEEKSEEVPADAMQAEGLITRRTQTEVPVKATVDDWEDWDVPQSRPRSEVHVVEPKGGSSSGNKHANYVCNGCKVKGHIRIDCPFEKFSVTELEKMLKIKKGNKAKAAGKGQEYSLSVLNSNVLNCFQWIIDSGATANMTPFEKLFKRLNRKFRSEVICANGDSVEVKGIGDIEIAVQTSKGLKTFVLNDVLYVPKLKSNLLSVREFAAGGHSLCFDRNKIYLLEGGGRIEVGSVEMRHYVITCVDKALATKEDVLPCKHELHKRFAHRNLQDISKMISLGLPASPCECSDICEDCLKGKLSRKPFSAAKPVAEVLDVVVSDVHGPMPVESIGRKRYFVTFIDAKSRYSEVKFIRKKSDVPQVTINYIESLKTQYGKKPKIFRSDRGTEYIDQRLQTYLEKEGIRFESTVGYCPQQNGIAERKNRTLGEAALTLLSDSGLPANHWAEAVNYANYCNNRVVAKNQKMSPIQMFCGDKPDWDKLRTFGEEVYVMIPEQKRNKLQPKSIKMKFIGFDINAKGYRVSNGVTVSISREVKFLSDGQKKVMKKRQRREKKRIAVQREEEKCEEEGFFHNYFDLLDEEVPQEAEELEVPDAANEEDDEWFSAESEEEQEQLPAPPAPQPQQQNLPELRRSTRTTAGKLPQRFNEFVVGNAAMFVSTDPVNDREAMSSPDADSWQKAKDEELEGIKRNDTWTVAKLPPGRKSIGCKWVFKSKMTSNGEKQFKARLVAQGFTQQAGIDFDEVFAPVANSTTIKILLTVAGIKKYHVRHYDVKSAFLNGELKEEIYMRPPPGTNERGNVYRLKKSLYGLKQAANVWNLKIHEILTMIGSVRSKDDDCLYSYTSGGVKLYLLIHVDDILIAGTSKKDVQDFMRKVGKQVEIKDLGIVSSYLGVEIVKNEEGFFEISQRDYIEKVLKVTQMENAKVSHYPMNPHYHRTELDGTPLESNVNYRKLIGMLLYLAVNSRPDIAAAVGILCQKVSGPTNIDENEARRVIRYLSATKSFRLKLGSKDANDELCAYTDADWAECRVDRKSNTGMVCLLKGSPVLWKSKKQTIVAASTAEAEFVALSSTAQEVIWIRRVVESFGITQKHPVKIFSDNQAAIAMVTQPKFGAKTKHIDTKFHHVKDCASEGRIQLVYVPTDDNTADILTKPLGEKKMKQFCKSLGFQN